MVKNEKVLELGAGGTATRGLHVNKTDIRGKGIVENENRVERINVAHYFTSITCRIRG